MNRIGFSDLKPGTRLKVPRKTSIAQMVGFENAALETEMWLSRIITPYLTIDYQFKEKFENWFPGVELYFVEEPGLRAKFMLHDLELYDDPITAL